jgi:transglutaminase superfamily protein
LSLPRSARRLLLAAAALQILARAAIAVCGLRRTVGAARSLRPTQRRACDPATLEWALAASARRVGGTCLTQALAASVLAGSRARATALVIGVRPGAGVPEFHAWIEIDSVPIPSIPAAPPFSRLVVWS